jgi:hypothetical protein
MPEAARAKPLPSAGGAVIEEYSSLKNPHNFVNAMIALQGPTPIIRHSNQIVCFVCARRQLRFPVPAFSGKWDYRYQKM